MEQNANGLVEIIVVLESVLHWFQAKVSPPVQNLQTVNIMDKYVLARINVKHMSHMEILIKLR